MNNLTRFSLFIFFVFISGLMQAKAQAEEPDWSNYNQLLKQYVKPGRIDNVSLMKVDYTGIKRDARYKKVVSQIASFDTSKLESKPEKLAFYMNAYNILAIKVVLDNWPVKSIKDVGGMFTSVWKVDAGKINHKTVSLNEVEHEILRKMGEPRIHMAIVCASVSCPDLRAEAYTASKLNKQLDEQSKMFLANNKKGLTVRGNEATISKIFDWFEDDFDHVGGVKKFVQKYNKNVTTKTKIDADIDYNWQLNGH